MLKTRSWVVIEKPSTSMTLRVSPDEVVADFQIASATTTGEGK